MLKDEVSRGLSEKGSRCGYRWSLPAADCAAVAGRCDDKIIVLRQGRLLTPQEANGRAGSGIGGTGVSPVCSILDRRDAGPTVLGVNGPCRRRRGAVRGDRRSCTA